MGGLAFCQVDVVPGWLYACWVGFLLGQLWAGFQLALGWVPVGFELGSGWLWACLASCRFGFGLGWHLPDWLSAWLAVGFGIGMDLAAFESLSIQHSYFLVIVQLYVS